MFWGSEHKLQSLPKDQWGTEVGKAYGFALKKYRGNPDLVQEFMLDFLEVCIRRGSDNTYKKIDLARGGVRYKYKKEFRMPSSEFETWTKPHEPGTVDEGLADLIQDWITNHEGKEFGGKPRKNFTALRLKSEGYNRREISEQLGVKQSDVDIAVNRLIKQARKKFAFLVDYSIPAPKMSYSIRSWRKRHGKKKEEEAK
jgi:hypothetical protein